MRPKHGYRSLDLGALSVWVQPVFEIGEGGPHPFGFRCLLVGADDDPEGPTTVADYRRKNGTEALVDAAFIGMALEKATRMHGHPSLLLPTHAATLTQGGGFPGFLSSMAETHSIAPSRLVLEVSAPVEGPGTDLLVPLQELRRRGFRVALDRHGLPVCDLDPLVWVAPDFVLLDPDLVRNGLDPFLERVRLLLARPVALGVSSPAEEALLRERGVDLLQGPLLSPALPISRVANLEEPENPLVAPLPRPGNDGEYRSRILALRS